MATGEAKQEIRIVNGVVQPGGIHVEIGGCKWRRLGPSETILSSDKISRIYCNPDKPTKIVWARIDPRSVGKKVAELQSIHNVIRLATGKSTSHQTSPVVTYEAIVTVTDDGTDGYMTKSMIKAMLIAKAGCRYSGVRVHVNALQELPGREEA